MRTVLISLMCHPERNPKVSIPPADGYTVFVNRTPNYAEAYKAAIAKAVSAGMDLVTADTDGYHPQAEILRLALGSYHDDRPAIVLPYRENLGVQSKAYSLLYSMVKRRRVRDTTTGLCRLSYGLMAELPPLRSTDMTVHIEILNFVMKSRAKVVQYGYLSGTNDREGSRRTTHYQWKLLKAIFR